QQRPIGRIAGRVVIVLTRQVHIARPGESHHVIGVVCPGWRVRQPDNVKALTLRALSTRRADVALRTDVTLWTLCSHDTHVALRSLCAGGASRACCALRTNSAL